MTTKQKQTQESPKRKYKAMTEKETRELYEFLKAARQHAASSQSFYEAAITMLKR
jgi:hypothetical protein